MYWVTKALSNAKIGEVVSVERKEITKIIVTGNDIEIIRPESAVRTDSRSYQVNYREREYYNVSNKRVDQIITIINKMKGSDKDITILHDGFAVELNW